MRIVADGFVLREWQDSDAERLADIADNKKIYDNLRDGFPHPYSLEDAKRYISFVKSNSSSSLILAIEIDGLIAGNIGAFFKDDVYRKNVEIGYFLAEEYWGKGIISMAIRELSKYVFDNYDIIRIYAEPFARNTGSRRALEKAGFSPEALMRCNVIKNGIIEDSCIYALLKDNFKY
ncbi:MAG: GNAT family protein [Bacillota bacterium]|nr:GNAT family protein [Bacillota bacterium]